MDPGRWTLRPDGPVVGEPPDAAMAMRADLRAIEADAAQQ